MAHYKIEDAKPEIKKLLGEIGAKNVKDTSTNRVIEANIEGKEYVIICYPIVLRKEPSEQRYIDINSSRWNNVVNIWTKACFEGKKCVLLAIRHIDDIMNGYILSVEGDLSKFPDRSIYVLAEYLEDMKKDVIKSSKRYLLENHPDGKLCVIKKEYFKRYLLGHDNVVSSDVIQKALTDYSQKFGDENISIVEVPSEKEGRRLYYYTTKYERSIANRKKAIEKHGTKCLGCGFDFGEKYGERGKGFIEIHHIKPLFEMNGETEVNPETDLVPVCSNCHRMIHKRKDAVLTIEELRKIVDEEANARKEK